MKQPKFIAKVKLTQQGQITLPTEARDDLKISLGEDLYWYEYNGSLIMVKDLVNQEELLKKIEKKRKK